MHTNTCTPHHSHYRHLLDKSACWWWAEYLLLFSHKTCQETSDLTFGAIAPWASTAARSCAVQEIAWDPLQRLGMGKQPPITFMSAFLRSLFKHMSTSRSQTALLWMVCSPSQAWVWARKHYPLTVKADFCFIAFAVIPHSWMLWEAVPLLGILCCVYFH